MAAPEQPAPNDDDLNAYTVALMEARQMVELIPTSDDNDVLERWYHHLEMSDYPVYEADRIKRMVGELQSQSFCLCFCFV